MKHLKANPLIGTIASGVGNWPNNLEKGPFAGLMQFAAGRVGHSLTRFADARGLFAECKLR